MLTTTVSLLTVAAALTPLRKRDSVPQKQFPISAGSAMA